MKVRLPDRVLKNAVWLALGAGSVSITVEEGVTISAPVLERVPLNQTRPYVMLSTMTGDDFSTLDEVGHDVTFTLDVFTGENVVGDVTYLGGEVCDLVMDAIVQTLTDPATNLDLGASWCQYGIDLEHREVFEEEAEIAGGAWHGVLRFSVLVDQREE